MSTTEQPNGIVPVSMTSVQPTLTKSAVTMPSNAPSSSSVIPTATSSGAAYPASSSGKNTKTATATAGSKRPLKTTNRDGEQLSEKKLRRLEKNRLSARECRRRKREATENLEREINVLEGENLRLRLQLQIGEEAEENMAQEQEKLTEEIDDLLKSGASETEIYATIEEFKEKFADYGRDRRSSMEFHLRNIERLLMPTTTTTVAMHALQGGDLMGVEADAATMNVPTSNSQAKIAPAYFAPPIGQVSGTATAITPQTTISAQPTALGQPAGSIPCPTNTTTLGAPAVASQPIQKNAPATLNDPSKVMQIPPQAAVASVPGSAATPVQGQPTSPASIASLPSAEPVMELPLSSDAPAKKSPKAMFELLVKHLGVTPEQGAALKDSRWVAQELDQILSQALDVLKQLRERLIQCSEDLDTEFSNVRSILTPTQAAKFLVWVANNGACMHMLNELWSKSNGITPSEPSEHGDHKL
mmetsp:Transcript_11004/g.17021  ORF Transcript_11004/g.17021 Transcript_11004/m.17021 type:complete len:474 (-) Transcript_11004:50-1471(-)